MGIGSTYMAKLWGLFHGIEMARKSGATRVIVELDNATILSTSKTDFVVVSILFFLSYILEWIIPWVSYIVETNSLLRF